MRNVDLNLHERRRQQIISAARTRFIANGFHQTGVQEIASAADVSLGLLYRYFKNKDALILDVARRDVDALVKAIDAIPNIGAMPDLWGQHMRNLMLAMASDESEMRLLNDMQSEASRNVMLQRQMQIDDERIIQAIERKITAQQAAGGLDKTVDPVIVAIKLTTIFDGMLARMALVSTAERQRLSDILSDWVSDLF